MFVHVALTSFLFDDNTESWSMMGLQSYVDVILSFTLPFIDFWYFGVKYLTTGQTITLSLVNGYIVYRFYQKTMDSAAQTQTVIKESVEREHQQENFSLCFASNRYYFLLTHILLKMQVCASYGQYELYLLHASSVSSISTTY